jgi:hypothetical protein
MTSGSYNKTIQFRTIDVNDFETVKLRSISLKLRQHTLTHKQIAKWQIDLEREPTWL